MPAIRAIRDKTRPQKVRSVADFAFVPVLTLIAVFQLNRLGAAMPTVLQDEYVYSVGAKYGRLSEAIYGNFLYFLVYGNTRLCGPEFYSCARYINTFFFVVFLIVIYVFAIRYLNKLIALFVVSGVGLGPIGLYVSVFMPEMMYFAFASLALLLYVMALESENPRFVKLFTSMSFLTLALGAMVKPHAAFVAVGLLVHMVTCLFLQPKSQARAGFYNIAVSILVFLVTKLGVGFVIAGQAGLTIFGASYTGALTGFFRDFFGASSAESGFGATVESDATSQSILTVLDVFAIHFLLILFSLFVLGLPGILLVTLFRDSRTKPVFLALVTQIVVMGGIVSFFAAYVTANGDDHSDRLLFRYFEFLVPFFIIVGLSVANSLASGRWKRWVMVVVPIASLPIFFLGLESRTWTISDGAHLYALFSPEGASWVWAVAVFVGIYLLVTEVPWRMKGLAIATSIALAIIGQLGINLQLATNGFKVSSDYAGVHVYENYADVPGANILVLGSDRKLVEAAMFQIDKPNITFELYESGSRLPRELIGSNYTLVVQTTGVFLLEPTDGTFLGDGFAVSPLE